jgi:UDP-N-acetylmuramoylalanine--D-glutamate ligase
MTTMTAPLTSIDDLAGRRVAVLGLARSGAAAARMLADAGASVTVYDRRPAAELGDAVASLGGRPVRLMLAAGPQAVHDLLAESDLVVTSPSVSARFPTTEPWLREALSAVEAHGAELVSEVDLFLRLTRARVLAVTGTKGKTTTTSLIGSILAAAGVPHAVGGNIGTPLVERVAELGPDDWAVLELSELQLPTISRGADIAVYTNVAADHLDRHASVADYRAVKARLAQLTVGTGRVVLNADDPGCRELGAQLPAASIAWYAVDSVEPRLSGCVAGGWIEVLGEHVMPLAEVPVPGRHLVADVLAAALAGALVGVPADAIARAVRAFRGVPHRLEQLGELDGVRYVNDSQATIPLAAMAALEAYDPDRVVLIAGGLGKGLEYAAFADAIAERCRAAILIGETAAELERLIGERVSVRRAGTMDEAVAIAAGLAQRGDVVLLSPAAASFDMFVDYASRGDAFRAAVASLRSGEGRS